MDAEALLKLHDDRIRVWARIIRQRYPLAFDEAYHEVQKGFLQGVESWSPTGGKSMIRWCRLHALGGARDYWVSTLRTWNAKAVLVGEVAENAAVAAAGPTMDAIESAEFWEAIYLRLNRNHRRLWLFLCLIYREGWTGRQIAKYFAMNENTVARLHQKALKLLSTSRSVRLFARGERGRRLRGRAEPLPRSFDIPRRPECCMPDCHDRVTGRGKCAKHYRADRARRLGEEGNRAA